LLSNDNDAMAASPFFSGRIPQSLFDAVEQHLQATGESKTTILKNALSAYLGLSPEPVATSTGSSRLEVLENRLAQVERILGGLQSQPNTPIAESVQPAESEEKDQPDNIDYTDNESQGSGNQTEKLDNSSDNRLDNTLENGKDSVITAENADNTGQPEFWTNNQINERLGVGRKTVESWNKRGGLPRTVKGHTIVGPAEKQKIDGRWQNTWKVHRD
jgi:hypothetical protein